MVRTNIDITAPLTKEEEDMLLQAANRPIVPDEDCPELSDEELAQFRHVSSKKVSSQSKFNLSISLQLPNRQKKHYFG